MFTNRKKYDFKKKIINSNKILHTSSAVKISKNVVKSGRF